MFSDGQPCSSGTFQKVRQINHCKSILSYPISLYAAQSPPPVLHTRKLSFPDCDSAGETLSFSDARVSVSCTLCSSEQSAKAKTQKELLKTLKELKMHLPSEKRSKGKSSTLNTLKYALRCVKQVKGKTCFFKYSCIFVHLSILLFIVH